MIAEILIRFAILSLGTLAAVVVGGMLLDLLGRRR